MAPAGLEPATPRLDQTNLLELDLRGVQLDLEQAVYLAQCHGARIG